MMTVKRIPAGIRRALGRLRNDRSGISLIYVTIALPAIIGFALLAIDVSRVWSLQSSLQHAADSLALAAAGELDRRPDAWTRADLALNSMVSNPAFFADSIATIDGSSVTRRFLADLPASDAASITNAFVAADAVQTRFIEVTVNPVNITSFFPASFLGGSNLKQAGAVAVAGFDAAVCDFTPMFVCNPYEDASNTDVMEQTELRNHFDRDNYPDRIGRLINMKQTGGASAQFFPGNFGFLQPQPPNNPGANDLRELVGVDKPPACFIQNGVKLRTGAIVSVRFGFNVRFDMYDGPMSNPVQYKNNEAYRPARDVRKGMATDKASGQGSPCNPDTLALPSDASKLLRDDCFTPDTCPNMGGRMGDGVWDKATYWSNSHNGAALPFALQGANVSRYDVYQYEIATAGDLLMDSNGVPLGGELGQPGCYGGPAIPVPDPVDRRIFHGAVLNCRALDDPINGGPISGASGSSLPVVAFVKFFLTEPVGGDKTDPTAADGDIWAEMVGIDEPGSASSVSRDMVQLYR